MPNIDPNEIKIMRFNVEEGMFVDSIIRSRYPRVFTWLAENIRLFRFLRSVLSLGITMTRHQDMDILGANGKGFSKGHKMMVVKSITTVVNFRGKEIARKKFDVGLSMNRNQYVGAK